MKLKWRKGISLLMALSIFLTMLPAASALDNAAKTGTAGYDSRDYTVLATPPILKTPVLPLKISPIDRQLFDGTQSSWAEKELNDAYIYGLTYPGVMGSFQKQITREEFCTIVVKLYEKISGKKADLGNDPFQDTDNPEILKAYKLKIVFGTAPDRFSPTDQITRQEICVMIFRALDVSITALDKNTAGPFPFGDTSKIGSWATNAMKFAYKQQIMKGVSATQIAPLDNTTREQAIVLLKRTLVKFAGTKAEIKATIPLRTGNLPLTDEHAKFKQLDRKKSLGLPLFNQKLELFVSTTVGRPLYTTTTTRPTIKLPAITPVYTKATFSTFINSEGDKKRWFAFKVVNTAQVSKVVWQVARTQFNGFPSNWKTPPGLVASGQVAATAKEFQIDFGNLNKTYAALSTTATVTLPTQLPNLVTQLPTQPVLLPTQPQTQLVPKLPVQIPPQLLTGKLQPIPQERTTFYVRAVPLDAKGNPVGDPGEGLAVIYGKTVANLQTNSAKSASFELWTPKSYTGAYSGEFQDRPKHNTTVGFSPKDTSASRLFQFHGLAAAVNKLVIQVSTTPFSKTGSEWPNTPNLVYEKSYALPTTAYATILKLPYMDQTYPGTVAVPFTEFAQKAAEMEAGVYTKYYVRGVALKPSLNPGMLEVAYSDTITIQYGFEPPIEWFDTSSKEIAYDNYVPVNLAVPQIKMKSYTPVKWEDKESLNHYYVFQKPTADQIKCRWKNTETNEVLYPYDFFTEAYYAIQGIYSKAQYEAQVIPRVLKVGTTVYFAPPKEEDKPWYEELYDGIVGFFKDLWETVKTIVNQVSAAYNNLKTGLINAVVSLCPFPELKGAFQTALEGLVNYGLVVVGLPPSLPNFDQLTEMNLDYLASTALTEAGVPNNQITQELVKDVAKGIGKELENSNNHAHFNPIQAEFLKLDPAYQYRPAYMEVELANPSGLPTVPGSFDLNVDFAINYYNMLDPAYGLNLVVGSKYGYGTAAGIQEANAYNKHFKNSLNANTVNYTQGGEAIYDVFLPVIGQKVPSLYPGEKQTLRIYLSPYWSGQCSRYPTGEALRSEDFDNMYFNNGNKKFTYFTIAGNFPTAEEYLLTRPGMFYLDPKTDYYFANEGYYNSEHIQRSVKEGWAN